MTLQEKIMNAFIGKVVRKDLAFLVKGGLPVPTYVLEYLLGQYCATDDEEAIEYGLEKVKQVIQNNYVHRAEAESVKGKIRESGRYRVIDKISVTLNEKADEYQADFANLGLTHVPIGTQYVKANPKLLSGNGVWCIITLGYLQGEDIKVRWDIQTLKPIQISNVDIQDFIDKRQDFTTDEWIDFMMHTVGLNPEPMNRREKFITLARLLPHVENNFNFVELGPKGTGKSHVFQELSPYGVLVSGGDVTSARLFVRMVGKKEELGLVGYWDVVAWDEFEQQKGRAVDAVLIDTMQNYLANKSFNRGKGTHEASASMSFVGNTKHTVSYMLKNSHLFESIPTSFIKGAFLDRIHLYHPGWELRMLKKDSFSKGYGLITDYIAACLHELRNKDLTALLKNYAKFDGSLSERHHLAIRKTFSGIEELENAVATTEMEEDVTQAQDMAEATKHRTRILNLKEGLVNIRMNQKGITYKSLFGDYFRSARQIDIVDPYIRAPFQIDNLIELIQTIREVSEHSEELQIHVSTQNDDEKVPEMIGIFDTLTDELQSYGIVFTYDFKADHDRWIAMDNGWKILLSRGLDVFEKFDRFSLGNVRQEERRCKAFSVTYLKTV